MRIAVFGRKNASVAYTLSDMASLDRDLDRLETAAERGHEAYDLFKATVGADDLHTARAAEDLAHIFLRRGEYDEAFTWFAEAERSALAGRPFTSANMESILVHWMVAMVVRNRMEEFREKLAYAKAELEKLEYRGTFEKITDRLEFLDQALRGEGGEDALEMATDLAVKLSPIQSYPLYSRAAFCRMAAEVQALAGHEEEREEWATLARELWPPIESHWVPR